VIVPASPDRPDDGFTLLELLVALALTAVIGTTMAIAITQLRPMRAFEERLDEQQIVSTLVDVIARDLKSAQRLPLVEAGGSSSTLLKGEPQKVTFTAVVQTGYRRRGLREVIYELVKEGDGRTRLLRTIRMRRFAQQQDADRGQTEELYSGELSLNFTFLRRDLQNNIAWAADFKEIKELPLAIQVELGISHVPPRVARATVVYLVDRSPS